MILLILIVLVTLISLNSNRVGVSFTLNNDQVVLQGPDNFELSIPFAEISSISIIDTLEPGVSIDGFETRGIICGEWSNDTYGNYHVCAIIEIHAYVTIRDRNGAIFIYNCENQKTTKDSGINLISYLERLGYEVHSE